MTDATNFIYLNGVDAHNGETAPPVSAEELSNFLVGHPQDAEDDDTPARRIRKQRDDGQRYERELAAAKARLKLSGTTTDKAALQGEIAKLEKLVRKHRHLGVKSGVDGTKLEQAGWGLILPTIEGGDAKFERTLASIKEALQDLLELRKRQAGARFRIFEGPDRGYRVGCDSKADFLARNGADPAGVADPDKLPYYLLIVAGPELIPFSFQYQLDVQYAVGRLWFSSREEFVNYAKTVVDAEVDGIRRPRRLTMFAPRHAEDRATELSSTRLIQPLHQAMTTAALTGWSLPEPIIGPDASRSRLDKLLAGGDDTPGLLLTASHGLRLKPSETMHRAHQGALICSDWSGQRGPVTPDVFFAAEHLSGSADISGMMLFCFACFGAGTPKHDSNWRLWRHINRDYGDLTDTPFLSALPSKLLGRPNGALAVVGHVDRAFANSFTDTVGSASHVTTFQSALESLMRSEPVGHALDCFNSRYAELSTMLTDAVSDEFRTPKPNTLAQLWTANTDARGYIVLGDPAARLSFDGGAQRPEPLGGAQRPEPLVSGPSAAQSPSAASPELEKPPELSDSEWAQTPLEVRRYIAKLRSTR